MSTYQVNVAKSHFPLHPSKSMQEKHTQQWADPGFWDQVNAHHMQAPFVLLDGPPYANGPLHVGHLLNKHLKSLMVRVQWDQGRPVMFKPGWDAHGLPLELSVERKYGVLPKEVLKKRCQQKAFRSLLTQRDQFQVSGVMADWNQAYVTVSEAFKESNRSTLKGLLEKDLLEYKPYPVHHCPSCESSLAEAELTPLQRMQSSLYFLMELLPVSSSNSGTPVRQWALVWTTTPWTLPMNQALVMHRDQFYTVYEGPLGQVWSEPHPKMEEWALQNGYRPVKRERGGVWEGARARSPLTHETVPVGHADWVEAGKTGWVHVACAHGPEDFEWGQTHGLMPNTYLSRAGVFTQVPASCRFLEGLSREKAKDGVLRALEAQGVLVHHEEVNTEVQGCWRHEREVFFNATWQCFLKLDAEHHSLKKRVEELVSQTSWEEVVKRRLLQAMLSRPHWCLSRQRTWGCPLGLWVNRSTQRLDKEVSCQSLSLPLKDTMAHEAFKKQYESTHEPVLDVLDVWFDSGNVALHQQNTPLGFKPVQWVWEGKDQYRGWFQSMVWLAVALTDQLPFEQVQCHGFVLDKTREKLAKSKGNAKPVEQVVHEWGVDGLSVWAALQEPHQDVVFSDEQRQEVHAMLQRWRGCVRFMLTQLQDYPWAQHVKWTEYAKEQGYWGVHGWVAHRVHQLRSTHASMTQSGHFKPEVQAGYQWAEEGLSGFYLDGLKSVLYLNPPNSSVRRAHQAGLAHVLLAWLKWLRVWAPSLAQEGWEALREQWRASGQEAPEHVWMWHGDHPWAKFLTDNHKLMPAFNEGVWEARLTLRRDWRSMVEPYVQNKQWKSKAEVRLGVPEKMWDTLGGESPALVQWWGVAQVEKVEGSAWKVASVAGLSGWAKCPRCWAWVNGFGSHEVCKKCVAQERDWLKE